MDNIIDNLRIRHSKDFKYIDVYHRLMVLHDARKLEKKQSALKQALKSHGMDRTWCRSRGFESAGHMWRAAIGYMNAIRQKLPGRLSGVEVYYCCVMFSCAVCGLETIFRVQRLSERHRNQGFWLYGVELSDEKL